MLDTAGWCLTPEYLAISRDVYDADGGIITGSSAPYGGAGEICMAGSQFGGGILPERSIDFRNGLMTYTPACCEGVRGDVNGDGTDGDVADLTCLVDYIFGAGCDIPCYEEADFNANGFVDVSDLTSLVAFLFLGGTPPLPCNCPEC